MGYYMILFLAGLQTVSPELYEAARMDGANVFQRFWNVTLPGIRPTMFLVTVLLTIASFKIFDLIIVLSPGGTAAPNMATVVLSQFIYQRGFIESKFGYASSAAVVLFLLCILTTGVQCLINNKRSARCQPPARSCCPTAAESTARRPPPPAPAAQSAASCSSPSRWPCSPRSSGW
jgi:multiple sugar transport system permease protein/alpha-1,4-digalacturonate transport system permease protein